MDDYISRKEAVEWFSAFAHMSEDSIPTDTVISDLKYAIPTADVEPVRWIPVSERLPKDFRNVLIWDKIDGDTFTGHYSKYDGWTIDGWEDANEPFEITHWMPLPKPPKKGGSENAPD